MAQNQLRTPPAEDLDTRLDPIRRARLIDKIMEKALATDRKAASALENNGLRSGPETNI